MTKTYDGTCAWCLGHFVINGTYPTRHGWKEHGGIRRVGEYGNVYHGSDCAGTKYPAYELAPDGTIACKETAELQLARCVERLAHLATRPTLYHEDQKRIRVRGWQTIGAPYGFRINDGEEITIAFDGYHANNRTYRYEDILKRNVANIEAEKRFLEGTIERLERAIDGWEKRPLVEHETAAPTRHYVPAGGRHAYCGSKSYYIITTAKEEEVTCTRCLNALAAATAEDTRIRGEEADGEALAAWLRENGPATVKELKAALGWDQKRLNKAMNRTDRKNYHDPGRIHTDGGRPAKWYVEKGVAR